MAQFQTYNRIGWNGITLTRDSTFSEGEILSSGVPFHIIGPKRGLSL